MNTAIAHTPVQIYDINPEQLTDLFCKKNITDLYFF